MDKGFDIVDIQSGIDGENVTFIRIKVTDYTLTLVSVLKSLMDDSWISNFSEEYLKISKKRRFEGTVKLLKQKFENTGNSRFKSTTAEKVVSETARISVIDVLKYSDIPLAELIKEKDDGNPGFDFYSENPTEFYVLFGEAKYQSNKNAYESALGQIVDFRDGSKHKLEKDIETLEHFCNSNSLNNAANGLYGFMAAFSCTNIDSKTLIKNIKNREEFTKLKESKELILIGVEL